MAQRLIVEGKDGYALSALIAESGLPLPQGYTRTSYRSEFVKSAGGIDQVYTVLREELNSPEVNRIGIVVDANTVGVRSRLQSLLAHIHNTLRDLDPEPIIPDLQSIERGGLIFNPIEDLRIGMWVMPDNENEGYLEHFLLQLIPESNPQIVLAEQFIQELEQRGQQLHTNTNRAKAVLATFLAIQEQPGLNVATAIRQGLLNHAHELSASFISWFSNTFDIGE